MLVNMSEMLCKARNGKYGIGFFNAVSLEMARSVIGTAERLSSPVIVGIAEVQLPTTPLEMVSDYLLFLARLHVGHV